MSAPPQCRRKAWPVIWLCALAALSFGLRFHDLAAQGLWADELFSVSTVTQVGEGRPWYEYVQKNAGELRMADSFLTWKAGEHSPPLFEALLWLWGQLFGWSDFAVRALSALLGSLTPLVLYAGLRRALSVWPAAAAALLFALSPSAVSYAQEARSYALLMLLASIAVLRLLRYALDEPGAPTQGAQAADADGLRARRRGGGFGVDVAIYLLLSYTHYTGLVLACALAGLRFALALWQRRALREFYWIAALPLLFAPWLYLNWFEMALARTGRFGWTRQGWPEVWSTLLPAVSAYFLPGRYTLTAVLALALLGAWCGARRAACMAADWSADRAARRAANAAPNPATQRAASAARTVRAWRVPDTRWLLFWAFAVLVTGHFGLSVYAVMRAKVWHPRYFSVMLPVVMVALALLFSLAGRGRADARGAPACALPMLPMLRWRPLRAGAAARLLLPLCAFLIACAASLAALPGVYRKDWKEEYREAAQFIVHNTRATPTVVTTWAANEIYYNYYLRRFMAEAGRSYVLTAVGHEGDPEAGLPALCQTRWRPGEQLVLFRHGGHRMYYDLLLRHCAGALRPVSGRAFRGLYLDFFETTGVLPAPLPGQPGAGG